MYPVFLKAIERFGFVFAMSIALTVWGQGQPSQKVIRNVVNVVPSLDGVPITFEVHGRGTPALVFVHGWSCDRSYWKAQLQPFSRRFKVVAVDLAGHGESGLNRQSWTISAFGADIAAVVEKLHLKRVILIGHSMGGDVIVEAARRLRGRVIGLVWIDTYKQLHTLRSPDQVRELVAPFRANFVEETRGLVRSMFSPSADPLLVGQVEADMSSAPPVVALGAMESALSYIREIPRALRELNLPVVAINPDKPATDVTSLKQHGVEVILMERTGHFPMMEDPERFNALLSTVIDKLLK